MAQMARSLGVPLLLGVDTHHFGAEGDAVLQLGGLRRPRRPAAGPLRQDAPGDVRRVRALCANTSLAAATDAAARSARRRATGPRRSTLGGVRIAPNICYESVLSHVIRRQVNALAAEGREPDMLVNLTNDGWFWGSSELDMHLACGVFRAVECRKPLLIAANTGFSAWIDGDGRILEQGPRRATGRHHRRAPARPAAAVGISPTATGLPACAWRRACLCGLVGMCDRLRLSEKPRLRNSVT